MEVVDELMHYIPELTKDNYLYISQFVLLPSDTLEASQYVRESNNNNELEKNEYSGENSYPSSVLMIRRKMLKKLLLHKTPRQREEASIKTTNEGGGQEAQKGQFF